MKRILISLPPAVGEQERDERLIESGIRRCRRWWTVPELAALQRLPLAFINAGIDSHIFERVQGITDLPIATKGIQCYEDAALAFDHGVDGIVLSDHGGRSQDTAQPPLLTLLEIDKFAPHIPGKNMQVFVDEGIRRGTDVIKALALGATASALVDPRFSVWQAASVLTECVV